MPSTVTVQTDPAHLAALKRRGIKDPGTDPVIAMSRERHRKELANEDQRLQVSGLSGAVLHKQMQYTDIMREIKILEEGVQEYQDQIDLLNEQKKDIQKQIVPHETWCATFRTLIGPFEAKYEECKAEVKVSFDYAKNKYHESLQKLIDDFGFHPAFKRCACLPWKAELLHPLMLTFKCFECADGSMSSERASWMHRISDG